MKGWQNLCGFFNIFSFIIVFTILVAASSSATVPEDDVRCLKGVKDSLKDPEGKLSSWTFSNESDGFICKFDGVACWKEGENRIINIKLRDMKLSGSIPDSLIYCGSLTGLDLSTNGLSGTVPSEICTWLPYLTSLNLSNNQFSGSIPPNLSNCNYLNELILANNKLSGSIPSNFSSLTRLKVFSVANNSLTGRVPSFFDQFDNSSFVGNKRLCGGPLGSSCGGLSKKSIAIIIAAGILGASFSILVGFALWRCC